MKHNVLTCLIVILSCGLGGVGGYFIGRKDNKTERISEQRLARNVVIDSMFVVGAPKDMFEELCVLSGVTEITPGKKTFFYLLKDKGDLMSLKEGDVIGFNVEFDINDKAVVVERVHHVHAQ